MLIGSRYFRPKIEAFDKEERLWTDVEKNLLIQGIEKYGIGNWKTISQELLKEWVY